MFSENAEVSIYDVHCHIHETPEELSVLSADDSPAQQIVFCIQATKYTDWDNVIELKQRYSDRVIPALGLHPWFVERVATSEIPETWAMELRQLLTHHGGILGECGLDKAARNPKTHKLYPIELQIHVLKTQLAIAHELDIPISLHCVRAFGTLAEILSEAKEAQALPPRIMLHSYSGSPDMLEQIFLKGELGKRVYVSFSSLVNGRNREKSTQCIRAVTAQRLLVESDVHNARAAGPALDEAVSLVAEARGWSLDEAHAALARNSREFFVGASK
ncbi:Cut9-interacting protein scn1 [Coemansia guatemalensis]|uniref:Cut9-interacting protein scn1 n=1 Tax=Coemansia guatemalensis TaxID=2761395 RepID=A0A9W8LVA1_9FUNG|nr:Cut9-interacting protein scn1 [Coemansia guatemalensis]